MISRKWVINDNDHAIMPCRVLNRTWTAHGGGENTAHVWDWRRHHAVSTIHRGPLSTSPALAAAEKPAARAAPRGLMPYAPSLSLVENMDGGSFSQLFGYLGSWPVGLCRAPPMCSAGDTLDLLCRRAFPRVDAPSVPFRTVKTKNLLAAS